MELEEATDEYALDDYEAESPPRASQQAATQQANDESPAADSDEEEDEEENVASPQQEQHEDEDDGRDRRDAPVDSPVGSVGKRRKRPLVVKTDKAPAASRVASLTRKLAQAKKRNAEMHNQLQRLYQNDAIAFLENKAQERQRQVEALQVENRTLLHQQRTLNKQIEELQDAAESMPTKRIAQREELRVCREQLRHYKELHKGAEEKSTRLHQQVVDLTAANKALADRVRQLESELSAVSPSSQANSYRSNASLGQQEAEGVIASQEDEITRLQHRVDVLKKAIKLDQSKHEKQALEAHQELEKAQGDLEALHQRAFEKEKVVRSQFLELKQLKRSLKEVLSHIHTNQELFESMGGRQVRFTNHSHSQSTTKTFVASGSSAHETLNKLGLLRLTSSASHASSVHLGSGAATITSPRIQDTSHTARHVPCPPSGCLGEKKTPRSARSQVLPTASTTPASRTSGRKRSTDRTGEMLASPFYEDVDSLTFTPLVTTSDAEPPQPTANEPS